MSLLNVTVPPVVFVNAAPVPPRIAETLPDSTAKEVPVKVPVVPAIEPLCRVTAPTVSLFAPMLNEPPFTVTAPASAKVFVA